MGQSLPRRKKRMKTSAFSPPPEMACQAPLGQDANFPHGGKTHNSEKNADRVTFLIHGILKNPNRSWKELLSQYKTGSNAWRDIANLYSMGNTMELY
ncbi:hypothetical protein PoB_004866600 [Plakobranchus ocellatus]|uniref:Uncharacterized protein n=1 Tax=Plakobranchus ocellatus TaxID=259542 RepID=A0AAV4BNW4_9GAST|nr:hypothetical protein PoB_004866600 [Plakobranchus ocellatus]